LTQQPPSNDKQVLNFAEIMNEQAYDKKAREQQNKIDAARQTKDPNRIHFDYLNSGQKMRGKDTVVNQASVTFEENKKQKAPRKK
jgi:predicted ATP-dependent Lon-type protease